MYSFLALGDSYTIGEKVPLEESFPYQTVALLRREKIEVSDPVIVAKTGWTTDELSRALMEEGIKEKFSFVTLLIGVNNQYRGRNAEEFKQEFTALLTQAISFANGKPECVFVLSIPDWGVTPFAEGKDRKKITTDIDAYNEAKQEISQSHSCSFLNITDSTRKNGNSEDFLAEDRLHPSGKEYEIWAKRLTPLVIKALKEKSS